MSNRKRTKGRPGSTKLDLQTPISAAAREAELHAIEEQFLSEYRAGVHPRLSTYLRRYPDYSAELAAFIAITFNPDNQSSAPLVVNEDEVEDDAQFRDHRAALSSGTRRALEDIFAPDPEATIFGQARVAEQRVRYVSKAAPAGPEEDQSERE